MPIINHEEKDRPKKKMVLSAESLTKLMNDNSSFLTWKVGGRPLFYPFSIDDQFEFTAYLSINGQRLGATMFISKEFLEDEEIDILNYIREMAVGSMVETILEKDKEYGTQNSNLK